MATERTHSDSDLQAALALFAHLVVDLIDKQKSYKNGAALAKDILALANPNALAEHDAALVAKTLQPILDVLEKHCRAVIHEETRLFWDRLREMVPLQNAWTSEEVAGIVGRICSALCYDKELDKPLSSTRFIPPESNT